MSFLTSLFNKYLDYLNRKISEPEEDVVLSSYIDNLSPFCSFVFEKTSEIVDFKYLRNHSNKDLSIIKKNYLDFNKISSNELLPGESPIYEKLKNTLDSLLMENSAPEGVDLGFSSNYKAVASGVPLSRRSLFIPNSDKLLNTLKGPGNIIEIYYSLYTQLDYLDKSGLNVALFKYSSENISKWSMHNNLNFLDGDLLFVKGNSVKEIFPNLNNFDLENLLNWTIFLPGVYSPNTTNNILNPQESIGLHISNGIILLNYKTLDKPNIKKDDLAMLEDAFIHELTHIKQEFLNFPRIFDELLAIKEQQKVVSDKKYLSFLNDYLINGLYLLQPDFKDTFFKVYPHRMIDSLSLLDEEINQKGFNQAYDIIKNKFSQRDNMLKSALLPVIALGEYSTKRQKEHRLKLIYKSAMENKDSLLEYNTLRAAMHLLPEKYFVNRANSLEQVADIVTDSDFQSNARALLSSNMLYFC